MKKDAFNSKDFGAAIRRDIEINQNILYKS